MQTIRMRLSMKRSCSTSIITDKDHGGVSIIYCTVGTVNSIVLHCTIDYVCDVRDGLVGDDDSGVLVDGFVDLNRFRYFLRWFSRWF